MRLLYIALVYLLTPLLPLYLLWRGIREPAYRKRWAERFGHVPSDVPSDCLWVHAASVGEVQAAARFIRALQQTYPRIPVLVTTMTPTGAAQLDRLLGQRVHHCYLPFDLPHAVWLFLRRVRPRLGLIVEMEFWPNLYHGLRRRGIPFMVVNARLSHQSAQAYRRFGRFMEGVLRCPARIAVQTSDDALRLLELGAPGERVVVTGSLKFDQEMAASAREQGELLRQQLSSSRPVWIAASTREGEEELVLEAHQLVLEQVPRALLILVPRHPDRFARVDALCREAGHAVARRSRHEPCEPAHSVYLGDTMGELPVLYAASDVAFVGGSLVPMGAHNVLEPAALGLPVLVGPHTFNFAQITRQLVDADACAQVAAPTLLADAVIELLEDPERRSRMGRNGLRLVEANRGATGRVMQEVALLLPAPRGDSPDQ
ncbi:MAG: lipid IV(A) 3-deoxy-D-manno-octulosonic acid transferase [Ectothiorhodospiraceae bacterium]|nr:lipid IV(A) 3-deoxy-D-manno-octulosonic acid transferase [Ectothiorhodospiraceae bacterium]MCH8503364.1 lipid IV(A) 3-deoxy-D-manno-octulosonic acid transferase [Ectothiorhodospiraceae bacterium]